MAGQWPFCAAVAVSMVAGDVTVRVWDLAERRVLSEWCLDAAENVVCEVAAADVDGRPVLVTGHWDGMVRVWDLNGQHAVGDPLAGHPHQVSAVAVATLDGRPVAVTAGGEAAVRVWDLTEPRALGTLTGHVDIVNAVVAGELDGRPVVVTSSQDTTVRVWDLKNQHCLDELAMPGSAGPMAMANSGTLVVAYGSDIAAFDISAPWSR